MAENARRNPDDSPRPNTDTLLAWLVALANKGLVELGLTLHVRGLIISGMLISWRKYLITLEDQIRVATTNDPQLVSALEEMFRQVRLEMEATHVSDIDPKPNTFKVDWPGSIHLGNAFTFFPDGTTSQQGALWRGKLISVDAWQLGTTSRS